MASASLGPGGVGSSRAMNSFKASTSSVDWLGREMLEMRLRDNRLDQDDDKVSCFNVRNLYSGGRDLSPHNPETGFAGLLLQAAIIF